MREGILPDGAPWPVEGNFHTYFLYGGQWFIVHVFSPMHDDSSEREALAYPVDDPVTASLTAAAFEGPVRALPSFKA